MKKKIILLCLISCAAPQAHAGGDAWKTLMGAGAALFGVGAVGYGIYKYVSEADTRALQYAYDLHAESKKLLGQIKERYERELTSYNPKHVAQHEINISAKRFPTLSYHDKLAANIKKLQRKERNARDTMRDLKHRSFKARGKDTPQAQAFVRDSKDLSIRLQSIIAEIRSLVPRLARIKNMVAQFPAYDGEFKQRKIEELERKAREQEHKLAALEARQTWMELERDMDRLQHVFCHTHHCYHCRHCY